MDDLMEAVHAALEAGADPDMIMDVARQIIKEWEEANPEEQQED